MPKDEKRKKEKNIQLKLEDKSIQLKLVSEEDVKTRAKKVIRQQELKKFAEDIINERIRSCSEYHRDEPIDKCVCEAVKRYINIYRKSPSKTMTKEKIDAIEKLFYEMIREGKIKCPE